MSLNKIFKYSAVELIPYLQKLIGKGYTDNVNYLYMPNLQSPLLLQAHIDSLATYGKDFELILNGSILKASGTLGADDRAGVFALSNIAERCSSRKFQVPNMLFTNFEETGGKGMGVLIKGAKVDYFSHINLMIALDRKGCNEYVQYVDNPKEVEAYIESFGFVSAFGSYSDCKEFAEFTKIPAVNLSIGYYNQHCVREQLHLDEMYLTISRVMAMIQAPIAQRYECKEKYKYNYKDNAYYHGRDNYLWNQKKEEEEEADVIGMQVCDTCNKTAVSKKTTLDGYTVWICDDCYKYLKPHLRG
jgi:M42 glutamyl aminopeptidase